MTIAQLILPLAQADAPPADFGPWLANAMYVILSVVGIVGGLAAWKSYRAKETETPQPFVVQQSVEFVPKPDFDRALREAHGRMSREHLENCARFDRIEAAAANAAKHLDTVVEGLRTQLEANNKAGEARVVALHTRINDLPKEVINLLRSTKGLLE